MKEPKYETLTIDKIVYGGQALGSLEDGKKVFVWGALPGETVKVRLTKNKKSWAEGIVEEVITPSKQRVAAKEQSYLSTSPWQILDYTDENALKQELIVDQFAQHDIKVTLNDFSAPKEPYGYRNKVEFSWWWSNEEDQLDLAFFKRGSHTKQPVEGTSLAPETLNQAARNIRDFLRENKVEAYQLKTLMIRCDQSGKVIAQLYVKDEKFPKLKWQLEDLAVAGLSIHFSNPKSPASVSTKVLKELGEQQLTDTVLGKSYTYAVDGFFQVNIPQYEAALTAISKFIDEKKPLLDMYSGTGSIGLSLAAETQALKMVEIDERCVKEAKANAKRIKPNAKVIFASSEHATENITSDKTIILDPPRAGLHQNVTDRLLEVTPETIIYLSCNPATQARDISYLHDVYEISYIHGYNFFPRTPHIENLVILKKKV